MRIWKSTSADALLVAFTLAQFLIMSWMPFEWRGSGVAVDSLGVLLLVGMKTYNTIVVSHLFTHVPWFASPRLNAIASMLNSINIAQSAQAYRLIHVRNHHRYNNDRADARGQTKDMSSTYRLGVDGQHYSALKYATANALVGTVDVGREVLSLRCLRSARSIDREFDGMLPSNSVRRRGEIIQVRLDRLAYFAWALIAATLSWRWFCLAYLPAIFLSLFLVNLQNYFEHFGANPDNRIGDSISYYGRLYNLLAFNDGFHQEHHLSPGSHWTEMPAIRARQRARLDTDGCAPSRVPAILRFSEWR